MLARCLKCGAEIPENAPAGWCPACAFERLLSEAAGADGGGLSLHDIPTPNGLGSIGDYRLVEVLGHGGMGVVYRAEQEQPFRRKVALKIIRAGMDSQSVLARFDAERQALAVMDHPGIAKVFDAGTTDKGRPYFVMELVQGSRITQYCDEHKLTVRERLDLFVQVCAAVHHAHQKGVIHRDLKPSNILVAVHDGVPLPKIIDFGIAKATDGRLTGLTIHTELHQFIGTPAYISPEQAEMTSDLDTRADIYSLGVLLYELLTGRTPFDATDLLRSGFDEMRRTIREEEPPRPSTRLTTLSAEELATAAQRAGADPPKLIHVIRGDLDWIVMKALEKDRARRYETASDFARDITRHLSNEPILARPPSATYRIQKAFQRHKVAFTAVAAIIAALAIGLGVSAWQTVRATRAEKQESKLRSVAEVALKDAATQTQIATHNAQQSSRLLYAADINLAQQALHNNNLGRARTLLDRHRPKVSQEDLRGWEWRYLWQQTRSSALATLTNRANRCWDVSFSKDGALLAVGWWDGRAEIWDVKKRNIMRVLPRHKESGKVAFSPSRDLLAATAEGRSIRLFDLTSGRDQILWVPPTDQRWFVNDVSFSRDGSRLVIYASVVGGQAEDAIWVIDVVSRQTVFHHPTHSFLNGHAGATRLSPDGLRVYFPANTSKKILYCLDVSSGTQVWAQEWSGFNDLTAMDVSPDGKLLATGWGFHDPTIAIWDAVTGRLIRRLEGHTAWLGKLRFTDDGQQLVSASGDQTVRIWDISTWMQSGVLRGHTDEVHGLSVSTSAGLIATASKDGGLMLWKKPAVSGASDWIILPDVRVEQLLPLDFSSILVFSRSRAPRVQNLGTGKRLPQPQLGSYSNIVGLAAPNVVARWDPLGHVILEEWKGDHFVQINRIDGVHKRPSSVALNPLKQVIAWIEPGATNQVIWCHVAATANRKKLQMLSPGLERVGFNETADFLFGSAAIEGPFQLWNLSNSQPALSEYRSVRQAAFANHGRTLVIGISLGFNHELAFYDLTQPTHEPKVFSGVHNFGTIVVSPDSELLVASDSSGRIRWFNPKSMQLIETTRGHLTGPYGGCFSPDGQRLATAGFGGEAVKIWHVGTRQELLTLPASGGIFDRVFWSSDSEFITIGWPWLAWRAPSWAQIEAAERKPASAGR